MDKKFYIINYKETIIDTEGVMNVECGTFDYGFETLEEAKKSLVDIAMKKVDDFEEDENWKVRENWTDDKEVVTIGWHEDTYEYSVYMVIIPDIIPPF